MPRVIPRVDVLVKSQTISGKSAAQEYARNSRGMTESVAVAPQTLASIMTVTGKKSLPANGANNQTATPQINADKVDQKKSDLLQFRRGFCLGSCLKNWRVKSSLIIEIAAIVSHQPNRTAGGTSPHKKTASSVESTVPNISARGILS